jgi:hypothetical protein
MKVLSLSLALILTGIVGCGKAPDGALKSMDASRAERSSRRGDAAHGVLTKEEVGAILGQPVTSVEGAATDMAYKTGVIGLETAIGLESQDDATLAITGARKATGMLGGAPEEVPNLGDEAFFGAMSILYVRKGDIMITITPPNLQLVAATAAYGKVTDAKSGPEQAKAMEDLMAIEKTDPTVAGLNKPDAVQGALATIAASSKKQGTAYETQARSMAMALAAKVLTKL